MLYLVYRATLAPERYAAAGDTVTGRATSAARAAAVAAAGRVGVQRADRLDGGGRPAHRVGVGIAC